MPPRRALALAGLSVAGLLLGGCADSVKPDAPPAAAGERKARCDGVTFADVRGRKPAYVDGGRLQRYPADNAVCAAYWLPRADKLFVPQSLEVDGTTAYVAGYRWHRTLGNRPCQLAVVDTRTGRTTAFVPRWQARVYGPEPTYCRHGGGMELTEQGLLVVETQRLWLLDPDRLGKGDPVLRVWRIAKPIRGSTLVVAGDELGVASHRRHRSGRIWWFRVADVMRPGVTLLDSPRRHGRVPAALQGMGSKQAGVWFSSSSTHCGELRRAGDAPVAFVPGAEDLEFRGDDLWTVSEASAKPYLDGHEEPVPFLLRLDASWVLAGPAARCSW